MFPVGYNPINGEPYATKDGLNSKVDTSDMLENGAKPLEEEEEEQINKSDEQISDNGHAQETASNGHGHASFDKPANGHDEITNGNGMAKVRS
jgi:hypothetical protein